VSLATGSKNSRFSVLIVLTRWFSERVRKMFGEMTKTARIEFWFDFRH
jgi:hypothetical protein